MTANFGVAQMRATDTWKSVYKRADTNLLAAKQAGGMMSLAED